MSELDAFGKLYLETVLGIDRHLPGFVASYVGPPDIRAAIEVADPPPVVSLRDHVAQLRADLPSGDDARAAFLEATLRALDMTLRRLGGESVEFVDEIAALYDIQPALQDESLFAQARSMLDTLLYGRGSLADKYHQRQRDHTLPAARADDFIQQALAEVHARAFGKFDLSGDNGVEISHTLNKPWRMLSRYLGDGRSEIVVNDDNPVSVLTLVDSLAQAAYPGHHMARHMREAHFYQKQGYAEFAVNLLHAPETLIAEAIATTAVEVIFPERTHHDWTADILIPKAGILGEPADFMRRIATIEHVLLNAQANAAILYHREKLSEQQSLEYLREQALLSERHALRAMRRIKDPLYRTAIFPLLVGYDLVDAVVPEGDKMPLFSQVLNGQLLPSQLAAMATDAV